MPVLRDIEGGGRGFRLEPGRSSQVDSLKYD